MSTYGFGFGEKTPEPAKPEAAVLAKALVELMKADAELADAKERVPRYTAQWSDEDYYANEQEAWNRAADTVYELLKP